MSSKPLYGKDALTESPKIERELEALHQKSKQATKPIWYSKYILDDPKIGIRYFWGFTVVTTVLFCAAIRRTKTLLPYIFHKNGPPTQQQSPQRMKNGETPEGTKLTGLFSDWTKFTILRGGRKQLGRPPPLSLAEHRLKPHAAPSTAENNGKILSHIIQKSREGSAKPTNSEQFPQRESLTGKEPSRGDEAKEKEQPRRTPVDEIGPGSDYFSDELNADSGLGMNMGMAVGLEVPEGVVQLNVGGTCFLTTIDTLKRDGGALLSQLLTLEGLEMNSKVAKRMSNGTIFIDRDGELFAYILDYLRSGKLLLPENFRELARLREEVQFYQLDELMQQLIPFYNLKYPPKTPTGQNNGSVTLTAAVAAAVAKTNALYETGGFITLGYRGTFAFGRDGQADVKFRKLHRILVCGKAQLCREVFGETLNESRDPDREGTERYTARLYLKHQCLERACDNLAEKGFRLVTACSSGANGLVTAATVQPAISGANSQRESGDMEEQRWAHYTEYVFYREPQFALFNSPDQSPRS
uniref:BTB domain-containing protein n=1 Tax=Globodera rostochiensis TaxID=31243 RepID=A0A914H2L2_GLORO